MASNIEGNKTISKLLGILDIFMQANSALSIRELVEASELPRASLYRILNPMLKEYYLFLDPATRLYSPGIKLYHLGRLASRLRGLEHVLPGFLANAHAEARHTVLVAQLSDNKIIYTQKKEKTEGLKISLRLGIPHPPAHGTLGRVILAFQDETLAKTLAEQSPPASWLNGPWPGWEAALPLLRRIRAEGFHYGRGERDPETIALGVPIRDGERKVEYALGMLVPSMLLDDKELERCREILLHNASEISKAMGYHCEK